MNKFKVGDRVRSLGKTVSRHNIPKGMTGTITDIRLDGNPPIDVKWDVPLGFMHGEEDSHWFVFEESIELVEEFVLSGNWCIEKSIELVEFTLPEKWCIRCTEENYQVLNAWRLSRIDRDRGFDGQGIRGFWVVSSWGDRSYFSYTFSMPEGYTEITFEQFKEHVLNEKEVNKKRTITAKEAQAIIDIACPRWKPRLANLWALDIVQRKDIEIVEPFYKEMRAACTKKQHELFDKIFGKDSKPFVSSMLRIGEVMVANCTGQSWHRHRLLKIFNALVSLDDPKYVWSGENHIPGEKLEPGTEVVIKSK